MNPQWKDFPSLKHIIKDTWKFGKWLVMIEESKNWMKH